MEDEGGSCGIQVAVHATLLQADWLVSSATRGNYRFIKGDGHDEVSLPTLHSLVDWVVGLSPLITLLLFWFPV